MNTPDKTAPAPQWVEGEGANAVAMTLSSMAAARASEAEMDLGKLIRRSIGVAEDASEEIQTRRALFSSVGFDVGGVDELVRQSDAELSIARTGLRNVADSAATALRQCESRHRQIRLWAALIAKAEDDLHAAFDAMIDSAELAYDTCEGEPSELTEPAERTPELPIGPSFDVQQLNLSSRMRNIIVRACEECASRVKRDHVYSSRELARALMTSAKTIRHLADHGAFPVEPSGSGSASVIHGDDVFKFFAAFARQAVPEALPKWAPDTREGAGSPPADDDGRGLQRH